MKPINQLQIEEEKWASTGIKDTLVSTLGRVKRSDGFLYTLQVCKSNGYNYVHLSFNNHTKAFKVSRLVAKAFIPNPENKKYVDHINTIRTDDRASNLRWTTASENNLNPISRKTKSEASPTERPWKKKPIWQYDLQGSFLKEWPSATDFGNYIGKNVGGNIKACIDGRQPTAYGFKWSYAVSSPSI